MDCTELRGSVYTTREHVPKQIQIGFCVNLSASASVSVVISQKICISLISKCAQREFER